MPPVDIYDTGDHELVIKAELPDMKREDIDLTVENNTLTISGEKKMDETVKEEQCHRIERTYGPFAARSRCRRPSTPPRSRADYKNGVLTVRLPHARGSQAAADPGEGQRVDPEV